MGSAWIQGTVMASAPDKVKNTTSEDEEEYFEPSKSLIETLSPPSPHPRCIQCHHHLATFQSVAFQVNIAFPIKVQPLNIVDMQSLKASFEARLRVK